MAQPITTGPSVNIGQMDKRFSMLFLESPQISADKSKEVKTTSMRLKKLMGRLFKNGSRKSLKSYEKAATTSEERLWNTIVDLTKPPPKTPSAIRTVKHSPAPKSTNPPTTAKSTISNPTTIIPPSDLPTYIQKDIFFKGKGKPTASSRDSKFSSISSLQTINISPSTTPSSTPSSATTTSVNAQIALTRVDFTHLQSLLRRTIRRLQQQEFLISNLSNNLLRIFARKEQHIQTLRRCRKADQQGMLAAIFRLKEQCGRLFLRKAAFLQHSFATLSKMQRMMEESAAEAVLSIPEACTSKQASEGVRYIVSREVIVDFITEMGKDMELQRGLDVQVRKAVLEKAGEERWVNSVGEGVMMIRFVGFLEGRLMALDRCYAVLGDVVQSIDGVAKDNEDVLLSLLS